MRERAESERGCYQEALDAVSAQIDSTIKRRKQLVATEWAVSDPIIELCRTTLASGIW